jgi:hypothetical protein
VGQGPSLTAGTRAAFDPRSTDFSRNCVWPWTACRSPTLRETLTLDTAAVCHMQCEQARCSSWPTAPDQHVHGFLARLPVPPWSGPMSRPYGPSRRLYLILVNFPISVAVAKEFCSAARRKASKVAPGCRPSASVLRAYSVNS